MQFLLKRLGGRGTYALHTQHFYTCNIGTTGAAAHRITYTAPAASIKLYLGPTHR